MSTAGTMRNFLFSTLCVIIGIIVISPVIYCVSASFMSPGDLSAFPPRWFPSHVFLDNYKTVFTSTPLVRFIWNSFLIAIVGTAGRLITSSLAAYAFSFLEFKGKKFWFLVILGTMMIPGDMLIITNYITVANMKLINTYSGVIIVMMASATYMFILRQHFLTISREYRDAAFIDGCGDFRFFTNMLVPMSRSILASIFIASFIALWNTYLWPLLVTNSEHMRTVQVGITMLQFSESVIYGPIMAGVTVILIPSILIFFIFQKQLVRGITLGGLKG
ncbi:Lactose transport system permease protein LacG [Paenibacillus konkukensis]|uniref:Lactose transport system permease protein LacG n=1 Tax=Paenibacillus konkukensis TaxID=2020716 RepID=A0ABY4RSC6_9BACL|nr:carbohydrate ABC transporter permease [Paenibacillus konkukensis]UQZ84649.1 Lactose transport system permease protein LacG [Paenibacillus konkukensis]